MEVNTLKYRRPDIEGGYLYDKDEIDYYRATQRNDVLDNLLLGDFNMVGAYVINNALVEELIKLNKVYVDAYAKTMFCDSVRIFADDQLHFCLNIMKDTPSKGKVTASLELLESIDRANGYYQNTNSALIDSHIFEDKANVNKQIFDYYHIIDSKDVGDEKREKDYEVPNIIRRQKELLRLRELCSATSCRLDKELFQKRIALLMHNANAKNILEEFNKQVFYVKDTVLDKKNPLYYRHLNQILDGILQQYSNELKEEKELLKNLTLVQVDYAQKQFKQEAIRNSEIIRHDDKERRDYFRKQQKVEAKQTTQEPTKVVKPEEKKPEVKEPKKEVSFSAKQEKIASVSKPEKEKTKQVKQPEKKPVKVEKKVSKENLSVLQAMDDELDDLELGTDRNENIETM